MHIVYSPVHAEHDPPYEFTPQGLTPYSDAPARAERVLDAVRNTDWVEVIPCQSYSLASITAAHGTEYLYYLENIYPAWIGAGKPDTCVIPDTFALLDGSVRPQKIIHQPGYYCFDAQTPIVRGTYHAAIASAHCALTGADRLLAGGPFAYALCRPPGHHAAHNLYGGYCYLNNAAIAATHLLRYGKVAILDVDYHHGNGTQSIFYESNQVLFVSLHADPNRAYPFFSGYEEETGRGLGQGLNRNLPLGPMVDAPTYLGVLETACEIIAGFRPNFLVVSLGVDTFAGDPLADFDLPIDAYPPIGQRISQLGLPTLVVQEGGYNLEWIGGCVVGFLQGLMTESERV